MQADARLLSHSTLDGELSTFKWAAADAKAAKAPLLISETNSICSGGLEGVSNSFASALWAIDYMLAGAENGVYGMAFHGGLNSLGECFFYSPLCPVVGIPGDYTAQPIYYGMLFTHLLGTGNLLPVTVGTQPKHGSITAFALKPTRAGAPPACGSSSRTCRTCAPTSRSARAATRSRPACCT